MSSFFCLECMSCSGQSSSTSSSSQIIKPVAVHNDYINPIFPVNSRGDKLFTYIADPYVFRDDDGVFYLFCTQTTAFVNDTYQQQQKGPIWASIDLVNWEYIGNVFSNYSPDWGGNEAGVWAPSVIKLKDKYVFYYSLSAGKDNDPGIGVAYADSICGPWTHLGKLFTSNQIGVYNSIDPHVIEDNGKVYMVFGSFGGLLTLIELEEDGLSLKGGVATQKEKKIALGGYEIFESNNYEGSFIFKHDGYYYLMLSTGDYTPKIASYNVVVARSEHIEGPYIDSKGRNLFGPKRGDQVIVPSLNTVTGTGHCCVIEDDIGDFWMIYHGYDVNSTHPASRVPFLDKLIFDEETGFPHVAGYKASLSENHGPYISILEE